MPDRPKQTRVYQNHHLDSTRWAAYRPRADDIIIATPYKAGTTWTQAIVANLLFPDQSFPAPPWQMSPWLDVRFRPLEDRLTLLEAQTHRRFIKTHACLDALPFHDNVRYIFISRDGRDVALSLWNHYVHYTAETRAAINAEPALIGDPLPEPPADFLTFWRDWCTRGWFEWESDGWPFWSHLRVTQSWWEYRHMPNILFLHYADMKRDPSASIRRIADFLAIPLSPKRLADVVKATSFEAMKRNGHLYAPNGGAGWKGGSATFLNKGVNGRWRDVLGPDDLALYDLACERALDPDCRRWLADGESALS